MYPGPSKKELLLLMKIHTIRAGKYEELERWAGKRMIKVRKGKTKM